MKITQWSNTRKGKQATQDAGHAPKFGAEYLQRCQKPQQRTAFLTLEGSRVSSLAPHPYSAVHFHAVTILCRTYDHRGNKLAHFRCHTVLATSVNAVDSLYDHSQTQQDKRIAFELKKYTMSWRQQDGTIFPIEISSPKTTVFNSKQSQRTRTQTLCRNIKLLLIIFLQCFHAISVSSGLLDKITAGLLGD